MLNVTLYFTSLSSYNLTDIFLYSLKILILVSFNFRDKYSTNSVHTFGTQNPRYT